MPLKLSVFAARFTKEAISRPLRVSDMPAMRVPSSYNDAVAVPHFASSSRSYLGPRRRGIADDRPKAASIPELLRDAVRAPCFLAQAVPLPSSTVRTVDFLEEVEPTPSFFLLGRSAFRRRRTRPGCFPYRSFLA